MGNVATFSPNAYVEKLWNLPVPGYMGYPGGLVSLTTYMSANALFDGKPLASNLLAMIQRITRDKPEGAIVGSGSFARVFTGQGMPDDIIAAMKIVSTYKEAFQKEPSLKPYFAKADYLQAMVDAGYFGMDCIGFVGTYLASAGVDPAYVGRVPLGFLDIFKPCHTLDDIGPRSVVALTNGMHIQLIHEIVGFFPDHLSIVLCQSASGGPQTNVSVTLKAGGGSYLPVEEFRAAKANNTYVADFEADNAARQQRGEKPRVYEMYLRARMTKAGVQQGYKGGAIFQILSDGEPKNPVAGSVYVGTMKDGLLLKAPTA